MLQKQKKDIQLSYDTNTVFTTGILIRLCGQFLVVQVFPTAAICCVLILTCQCIEGNEIIFVASWFLFVLQSHAVMLQVNFCN